MATAIDTCAAKTGEPGAMRECGQRVVYLAAGERGNLHSGWHHEAPADHHAVPRAWVR